MTKKARNGQRVKTRKKGRQDIMENGSDVSVSGSRSYIALAHSRAPKYLKPSDESEDGFPEGCAITRADFRTIMGSRLNTPLPRIGAESHLGIRVSTPSEKSDKNEHFLPDINGHIMNRMKRPEDQLVDQDMYDVECIRKTRSGIAFTQFVGRPYRLPRLLSDGQIERRIQPRVNHYASFVPIKSPEVNRSGGNFADKMRNEVEESRQRREDRNLDRMRRQLQEREGRASRIGRSCDSNEERVRAVVEVQDSIRKASFQKHVRQFMDKRH
ncbi:uncharacterized protein LOC123557649 [Mercenaria mercenaria]|uniref:uncharacterized protein LOC123557649 n=1 Tax=Mercenaria mercenaria TaxID=6596 RepID=UPI001E1DDC2B|nr:uncharacterized protein LOC123557649 [Mercenaria mercenaria]